MNMIIKELEILNEKNLTRGLKGSIFITLVYALLLLSLIIIDPQGLFSRITDNFIRVINIS